MTHLSLDESQRELVEEKTLFWIQQASEIWDTPFKEIPVRFDLKGKTSGMYCCRNQQKWIRYNPYIFAKHFDESLAKTVPHEVAHYICHEMHHGMFNIKRRFRPKPHGKEWKAIMQAFGVPADATCKLDISDLPQKTYKRHLYRCDCSEHELTSIRHNRILKGKANYACPKCHTQLTPA